MATESPKRRAGFTIPGYAAAAARKGHELGLCRQWTPEEARRFSQLAVDARRAKQQETRDAVSV